MTQTYIFETNGRCALETHYKNGAVCELTKSRTGDYTFDDDTKDILIHDDTGHEETFTVYNVSETEMWLNLGRIDTGNEEEMYDHILAFKKQ